MADERNQRMMHEALDDQLAPGELDALYRDLDTDPKQSSVFERLRSVDRMLKEAPFEGAPQTLALRVLAKIAEIKPEQLRRGAGLALALGLGLVALLLLPLLSALGWLVLNVLSNPAAAVQAVIGVLASLMSVITGIVQSIQAAFASSPLAAAAVAALLPVGYVVLRRIRGQRQDQARRDRLGRPPATKE
jgi:anti-sigma factor RsiW